MKHIMHFANGDQMPAFGLGTWKSKKGEVYQAIIEAVKIGYRHFDCAAIYENETEIGEAFHEIFRMGIVSREELWITSKLWNSSHEQEQVIPACEKTLRDLQIDYLDLYLVHWPVALKSGVGFPKTAAEFLSIDQVPLAGTWRMMDKCRKLGLTRHIGVSNFSIKKIRHLIETTGIKPELNQVEMHPYLQQKNLLDFGINEKILLTAYSPLGSDLPKGNNPNVMYDPVIATIAKKHGATHAQILIAWALQRETSVIPKSVNPERLKQNFEATKITLTDEEFEAVNALDKNLRYVAGSLWCIPGSGITMQSLWDE